MSRSLGGLQRTGGRTTRARLDVCLMVEAVDRYAEQCGAYSSESGAREAAELVDHLMTELRRLRARYRRRAGLCPDCGAELEERRWVEAHGEPWLARVCPVHGEVGG